jgi:hypothetical protein
MIWKEVVVSLHEVFSWEDRANYLRFVTTADIRTKMRNKNLPNRVLERYHEIELFESEFTGLAILTHIS